MVKNKCFQNENECVGGVFGSQQICLKESIFFFNSKYFCFMIVFWSCFSSDGRKKMRINKRKLIIVLNIIVICEKDFNQFYLIKLNQN